MCEFPRRHWHVHFWCWSQHWLHWPSKLTTCFLIRHAFISSVFCLPAVGALQVLLVECGVAGESSQCTGVALWLVDRCALSVLHLPMQSFPTLTQIYNLFVVSVREINCQAVLQLLLLLLEFSISEQIHWENRGRKILTAFGVYSSLDFDQLDKVKLILSLIIFREFQDFSDKNEKMKKMILLPLLPSGRRD